MSNIKPLSPEQIQGIIHDLQYSDLRIIDIAAKYGTTRRRVTGVRDEYNVEWRQKNRWREMTPEWKDEIVEDLMSGMKLDDIYKKHHIGFEKVADIQAEYDLFRYGHKRRQEDDRIDWRKYGPIWDKTRKRVLKALNVRKYKKRKSWIDLWLLGHESR